MSGRGVGAGGERKRKRWRGTFQIRRHMRSDVEGRGQKRGIDGCIN